MLFHLSKLCLKTTEFFLYFFHVKISIYFVRNFLRSRNFPPVMSQIVDSNVDFWHENSMHSTFKLK